MRARHGFTLLEVLVALTVLGLLATVLAARVPAPTTEPTVTALSRARAHAVRRRTVVAVNVNDTVTVRYAPDGTASAASWCAAGRCWSVDRWTGQVRGE